MNGILHCPFCGKKPEMQRWKYNRKLDGFIYDFVCHHCGCSFNAGYCETEEEAIAKWNTRAERTCHEVLVDDGTVEGESECSECHSFWYAAHNYCPYCGAKVVEE